MTLSPFRAATSASGITLPLRRLIAPYLPRRAPKLKPINPPPHDVVARPPPAPKIQSSLPRRSKISVRRGILRERSIPQTYIHFTPAEIRAKLKSTFSIGSRDTTLSAAISLLDNQLLEPSSSNLEQQNDNRLSLYGIIVTTILQFPASTTPSNLNTIYKIFEKQHSEKLPINPQVLTMYLKAAINTKHHSAFQSPMKIIASVFPFLPESYDLQLLTLILSTTVRYAQPRPEDIKNMIMACVSQMDGEGKKGMQGWDLELWDIYMGSLLADGQMREAVKLLPDFKAALEYQRVMRSESVELGTAVSVSTLDTEQITRPYITLLSHWIESSFPDSTTTSRRYLSTIRNRSGSETPLSIVSHCLETLDGAVPPVELWNVWLKAEVIAENYQRAERIWEMISGSRINGTSLQREEGKDGAYVLEERNLVLSTILHPEQDQRIRPPMLSADLQPDSYTYTSLFSLLKRISRPPSRAILRTFLSDQTHLDVKSLNAALSTLFTVLAPIIDDPASTSTSVDLPAALILLQQFSPLYSPELSNLEKGISPTARTVDIVSAGLIRLSQRGLPIFGNETPLDLPGESPSSNIMRRTRLQDWDLISRELDRLRDKDPTMMSEEALLPVGQPFARLIESHKMPSSPVISPLAETGEVSESDVMRHFEPLVGDRSAVARELLPALERLLRRGIAMQMEKRGSMGGDGDNEVEEVLRVAREEMGLGGRK